MGTTNPYEILGVPETATDSQIRSAYRKLALVHHPDKGGDPQQFQAVADAYETIGTAQARRQFDSAGGMNDQTFQQSPFHHHHDPFAVFAEVFGDEFGRSPGMGMFGGDPFASPFFQQQQRSGMFDDPFFHGNRNVQPRRQQHPFFSSPFGGDPFGDPFHSMRQMQQRMDDAFSGNSFPQGSSFSSTSTTTTIRNGERVTTTTRTTTGADGKPQTTTERIVQRADGTEERTIENGEKGRQELLQDESRGRQPKL